MALTRTQEVDLVGLLVQKFAAQAESDTDRDQWVLIELVQKLPEEVKEALFDGLLGDVITAQTAERDRAVNAYESRLGILNDKVRT